MLLSAIGKNEAIFIEVIYKSIVTTNNNRRDNNHRRTNMSIRPKTIKLIKRIITPIVEEGVISVTEFNEIVSELKYLAEKAQRKPIITPRLIDRREVADLLGISLSNFKKQEREQAFPFKRKMVGTSIRYRNIDIFEYILASDA